VRAVRLYLATFALVLFLDQAVKEYCRLKLIPNQSLNGPFPGFFEIKLTFNEGIAFGMFQGQGILFAPVALIITYMAFHFSYKHPHEKALTHFSMGLLSAGAIGNLIDRVWLHRVTDMMWLRVINFPIFNIADVAITFGAILLGIRFLLERAPEVTADPLPDQEPIIESSDV